MTGRLTWSLVALATAAVLLVGCRAAAPPPMAPATGRPLEVVYGAAGGEELRLDVYRASKPGLGPAVLLIHGGAWRAGDKSDLAALAAALSSQGIACVSLNYRLAPEHRFPAQIQDCAKAVRWVRAHGALYGIDPGRVAAWGESAGGQLALLLGTLRPQDYADPADPNCALSAQVDCVVAYFAPADFGDTAEWPLITRHYATDFFGGGQAETVEIREEASPVLRVSKWTCPVYLVHGAEDHLVPPEQSQMMKRALDLDGVVNELVVVPGAGHNLTGLPDGKSAEIRAAATRWLLTHLK